MFWACKEDFWGNSDMPRANRYITLGRNYHLAHRCHNRSFLLKFAKDRDLYRAIVKQHRARSAGSISCHVGDSQECPSKR